MSKYNKGDKFIIELDEQMGNLWRVKGFSTLVFDNFGLDRLGQLVQGVDQFSYRKGIEDAWGLVKFLELFSYDDLMKVFGTDSYEKIYNMGYTEVAAKVEAWEKWNEIQVGGIYRGDGTDVVVVVTYVDENKVEYLYNSGESDAEPTEMFKKNYTKTDRSIEIKSMLNQIK